MRNLKKFLALVLAMVMTFSLMLTANAANPVKIFDDSANITEEFVEAADVLTGMKIFQGDERGFAPGDSITRAEVAALIYRLATGDVDNVRTKVYANYGNFEDVSENDWFAGYVGYCANAGYIKGKTATTFDPYASVTGYETLAMILRAIGYDKNNEFTGAAWETNVSALATQLHILDNIKTTHYGSTLYLASRRDVVAELLFRADAYVPMVVYTPAFGYQPTGMDGGVIGTAKNPTLGAYIFGLTNKTDGVVIGNQETGEKATIMGYAGEATTTYVNEPIVSIPYSEFTYAGTYNLQTTLLDANGYPNSGTTADRYVDLGENIKYNLGTGIDLMGHKVNIWYDNRSSSYNSTNGYPVYAYFDEATLAEVVKVVDYNTDADLLKMTAAAADTRVTNLYSAMKAAGFSVNSSTKAYLNNSFGRFSLNDVSNVTGDLYTSVSNNTTHTVAAQASPERLYMVVSNNSNKTPDAVIALNLQTTQITGVDNVNNIKTITVPFVTANQAGGANSSIGGTNGNSAWPFIAADNVLTNVANTGAGIKGGTLEQGQLVGDSSKTLGQKVIGLHITGTPKEAADNAAGANLVGRGLSYSNARTSNNPLTGTADYDQDYFKMVAITDTKDGVVVGFTDKTVTLQDGTVLEKSIVYDTVVAGTIPQVTNYEHTNYRFYLTADGKFVGADRQYGASFIYGTYMDYSQELSTSTFKYYLTGVTLDGEITTVPVSTLNSLNNKLNSTNASGIPHRDSTAVNGIGEGVYRGFAYSNENINWGFDELATLDVVAGANNTATTGDVVVDDNVDNREPSRGNGYPEVIFDGDSSSVPTTSTNRETIVIDASAVALGAAEAGVIDVSDSGVLNPATNADLLYFTENTKFILVSGYGTDSLKAEVFDGISDLRGSSNSVSINLHYTVDNTSPVLGASSVRLPHIKDGAQMSDLTYMTQSPFIYAQNQVLSRQANVIILPAAAVEREDTTSLRYVGSANPTLVNSNAALGEEATRFTMYSNGVAENVWIEGLVDTTNANTLSDTQRTPVAAAITNSATAVKNTGHDHFYLLTDTGKTANDGQPIYTVTLANLAWTQNTYVASTYSAQTGSFTLPAGNGNVTISKVGNITVDELRTAGPTSTKMMNVGNANITNLNAGNPNPTWPGITNLTTLNEAGSLGIYNNNPQYGGYQELKLSVILDGSDPLNLTISQIYVCYQQ